MYLIEDAIVAHRECMLLLCSTIAFFHNAACNNPRSTRRTTSTSRCNVVPATISTQERQINGRVLGKAGYSNLQIILLFLFPSA